MPFDFQYSVKDAPTANDYNHKAVSDGDVTRGEYRVAMPDGRTQVVRYTAGMTRYYSMVQIDQIINQFLFFFCVCYRLEEWLQRRGT